MIKYALKRIILFLPKGQVLLRYIVLLRNKIKSIIAKSGHQREAVASENLAPKEVFTNYYRDNFWGNEESVSGGGSTLAYTENIRMEIPKLLEQYQVKRFLDAPCGDYNWFRMIKMPAETEYVGGDIVDELIQQNQLRYGGQHIAFVSLDIVADALPHVDLWMCRDCLFHFSYEDIFKTLENFVRSDIGYLFTSVHTDCKLNTDIVTGGVRLLNLELPPFNLCKPILYVDDWIPNFHVRKMGLWTRSMVLDSLVSVGRIK